MPSRFLPYAGRDGSPNRPFAASKGGAFGESSLPLRTNSEIPPLPRTDLGGAERSLRTPKIGVEGC